MSKFDVRKQLREQTVSYVVAALSVVAGLAWNDAVRGLIEIFFPGEANSIVAKFCYAIFITFAVVILTIVIRQTLDPKSPEEK